MKYRIKTFLKYQDLVRELECTESSSDHDRSDGRIFKHFQ